MAFDFASVKSAARRVVQETFGVQAFYADASLSAPIEMRIRWHDKTSKPYGDLVDGSGYAEVVESIERIVCIPEDLEGNPVVLQRQGTFTSIATLPGATITLDYREPATGVLEEVWRVVRS